MQPTPCTSLSPTQAKEARATAAAVANYLLSVRAG